MHRRDRAKRHPYLHNAISPFYAHIDGQAAAGCLTLDTRNPGHIAAPGLSEAMRGPPSQSAAAFLLACLILTLLRNTPRPSSTMAMPSVLQSAAMAAGNSFAGIGRFPLAAHASA